MKRIPAGTYDICFPYDICRKRKDWRPSSIGTANKIGYLQTKNRLDKYRVPITRDLILIHAGNYVWHSTGCLLAGQAHSPHEVEETFYHQKTSVTYPKGYKSEKVSDSGIMINNIYNEINGPKTLQFDDTCKINDCFEISITIRR